MAKRIRKKEPKLLIDGNNMVHRNHAMNADIKMSAVFGTLKSLRSLITTCKPKKMLVCWDGGLSKHRLKIYPQYKQGRSRIRKPLEEREIVRQHIKSCQGLIGCLGITQYRRSGVEADDIICLLSKKIKGKIIIVSTDKDFLQLIDHKVSVLNPMTGVLWTVSNFIDYKGYGFTPAQYLEFKCLVGDPSDNIKGVPNVGEETAKSILNEHGCIAAAMKIYGAVDKLSNWRIKYFLEGEDIVVRNKRLMDLKLYTYHHMKRCNIKPKVGSAQFGKAKNIIAQPEFSFQSFLDDYAYWSLPFRQLWLKRRNACKTF